MISERFLLETGAARELYGSVAELPIIDYHCHLDPAAIARDDALGDAADFWLGADHYKWRAMRLCGVPETHIMGNASRREKFDAYLRILPLLAGNPLYDWSWLELERVFSGARNYEQANEALRRKRVSDLLKQFRVETIVTTDDPADSLEFHGVHGGVRVLPGFRPDRAFSPERRYLERLGIAAGREIRTLSELETSLKIRLDTFIDKGCRVTDHGFDVLPPPMTRNDAEQAFAAGGSVLGWLLPFLAAEYVKRGVVMQLHFSTLRNVNSAGFSSFGADAGFDVFRNEIDGERLVRFLDDLAQNGWLPRTVLYTLNPNALPMLCAISGAFPNVRIGAAWWFNDTLCGIRRHLETVAEYAVLGTNLGMLTDSRSFASYVRFEYFRRILAGFLGKLTEEERCAPDDARTLARRICYDNPKEFFAL